MGKIEVAIDLQAAIRAGRLQSGRALAEVPDEQIAGLSPERRQILLESLTEIDTSYTPNRRLEVPRLRAMGWSGGWSSEPAKLPAATWECVVDYLDKVIASRAKDAADRAAAEAERQAEAQRREHDFEAEIRTKGVDAAITYTRYALEGVNWKGDHCILNGMRPALERLGLVAVAEARCAELSAAGEAYREEQIARRKAEEAARLAARDSWISEHGSERLRKALALGLADSIWRSYREERLALERPGWRREGDDEERGEVREPTSEALAALEEARKRWPQSGLVWLKSRSGGVEALADEDADCGGLIVCEVEGGRDNR